MRRGEWLKWSGCLVPLMLVGWLIISMHQMVSRMNFRCQDHPAVETFARYFGDPPPGVTEIHAEGYIALGGAEVWLRFRCEDASFRVLTREYELLKSDEAREQMTSIQDARKWYRPPKSQRSSKPEHRVDWAGIKRIAQPKVYRIRNQSGGSRSTLIHDPERTLVYFYHWNQ